MYTQVDEHELRLEMDNGSELPEELKEAATVSNKNVAIFSFFILGIQKEIKQSSC